MPEKYYLTTPLYYVNSKPHIGHAYTQIASDVLARYWRASGREVLFLTGTDEHGQKIDKAAKEAGETPQVFTDRVSATFRDLWKVLDIQYDDFIRTTEDRHKAAVAAVWRKLFENGDVYRDKYTGWYCTPDETFWTDGQIVREGASALCPDCRRPVEHLEEENFFFKLSKYQSWLTQTIRDGKSFLVFPETRRNEVLGFLDHNTLQDLCISRPKSRLAWGIVSPLSDQHVTYVWFDALINYISAVGYGADEKKLKKWWPADVHLIGKDILRHHAVIWPILLHALGLEPPKMVFAHGWWVQGGEKMSKSRGNVTDPIQIVEKYGVDVFRYFLLREAPFGQDGTFSEEALITRANADLANGLGNLLSRTLTMCEKYCQGHIPAGKVSKTVGEAKGQQYTSDMDKLPGIVMTHMRNLAFSQALENIWGVVMGMNEYIEQKAPWKLAKEGKQEEVDIVMRTLCEHLKVISQAVYPFMPSKSQEIWTQLGLSGSPASSPFKDNSWGFFENGGQIAKGASLFPRIEIPKNE